MGVTLSIEKLDGTEHPDWNPERFVGDREIADYLENKWPYTRANETDLWEYLRPDKLDELIRTTTIANNFPYPQRFMHLVQILRDNPDYWLDISR